MKATITKISDDTVEYLLWDKYPETISVNALFQVPMTESDMHARYATAAQDILHKYRVIK